jgi:hypothetical protein
MERVTKEEIVGAAVAPLPVHLRKLVRDVAYGRVQAPPGWFAAGDADLFALDAGTPLDAGQAERMRVLIARVVTFFVVVAKHCSAYADELRSAGLRDRGHLDSIRRTRGPRAVRDLLFERLPCWSGSVPEEHRDELRRTLERGRETRQLRMAPLLNEELGRALGNAPRQVAEFVGAWGREKGLAERLIDEVVSDVVAQLLQTVAHQHQVPAQLQNWSRSTAKWKLRAMSTHGTPGPNGAETPDSPDGGPPDLAPQTPTESRDVADTTAGRVDMQRARAAAVRELRAEGMAYRDYPPPQLDSALVADVAADILELDDVDLVTEVVERSDVGDRAVAELLARRAATLTPDRLAAVSHAIRFQLARAIRAMGNHPA